MKCNEVVGDEHKVHVSNKPFQGITPRYPLVVVPSEVSSSDMIDRAAGQVAT